MPFLSDNATPFETSTRPNEAVVNNGSRFGFKFTQELTEGVYALGRAEWRFRGDAPSQHDFDHLYVRQAYAGFGHKQYGELTYGNQTVITDEVKQTDLPNKLSLSDGLLDFAARRALHYVYSGVSGLRVGGYYAGHSERGDNNRHLAQDRKREYGAGATYRWTLADKQSIKFGLGFSRENYQEKANNPAYHRAAFALGTAYTWGATTVGVDWERRETHNQSTVGNQRVEKEVRTVLFHRLTEQWNAYGMYAHKRNTLKKVEGVVDETRRNQFLIGTEHAIAKQTLASYNLRAKTFIEWQTSRNHRYVNGVKTTKTQNNATVIGFRVYW